MKKITILAINKWQIRWNKPINLLIYLNLTRKLYKKLLTALLLHAKKHKLNYKQVITKSFKNPKQETAETNIFPVRQMTNFTNDPFLRHKWIYSSLWKAKSKTQSTEGTKLLWRLNINQTIKTPGVKSHAIMNSSSRIP